VSGSIGIARLAVTFSSVAAAILLACSSPSLAPTAAASPSPTDAVATAACRTTGYDGTVVGAFRVRAEQLAIQDETPRNSPTAPHPVQSQFRAYAPDTLIVICYYDGPIAAPGGGPPGAGSSATFRPYDRYALAVDDSGKATLLVAGRRDTLAVGPHMPGTR